MANNKRMNFVINEEVEHILHKQENMSDIVNEAILRFFNKKDDRKALNSRAKCLLVSIEEQRCELIDISSKLINIIEEGNKMEREEAEKQKKELDEKLRMNKQYSIDQLKPFFLAIKANMLFFDKCFGNGLLLQDREWDDLTCLALEMNNAKIHTLRYDAYLLWNIGKLYDDLKDLGPEEVLEETNEEG